MNIFYSGYQYDYGDKKRGYSYEYYNFYKSLIFMDKKEHNVFNYRTDLFNKIGNEGFNNKAINIIDKGNFNLAFFVLFKDEFKDKTLDYIKNKKDIVSVAWMSDDHWRFDSYGVKKASFFNWIVTTDRNSYYRYKELGFKNVILSQWGFNHFIYKPNTKTSKLLYEVSFVGQPHSNRKFYINKLKKLGLNIYCRGFGWKNGKISFNEMINVFRNSKININFTSSSFGFNIKSFIKIFFFKTKYSIKIYSISDIIQNIRILFKKNTKQIKGRIFEIIGCKGFLISEEVNDLNKFYNLKNEVITFSDYLDLKSKIYFYLNNKEARERIINNAYKKTIKYHTYENRFRNIFKKVI